MGLNPGYFSKSFLLYLLHAFNSLEYPRVHYYCVALYFFKKLIILSFSFLQLAMFVHLLTFAFDIESWPVMIYIRNQFIGLSFLCCCIQILDFLSFHHLFGPWAIIIISLLVMYY